jgi:hypothetical protein
MILLCRKITVAKCKEVKIGSNRTESSNEGYGSERAVLPIMMMKITFWHESPYREIALRNYLRCAPNVMPHVA